MTPTRTVLPIGFEIINDQEAPALYITDDAIGQNLDLEITNTSSLITKPKNLPEPASPSNHHFEVVFRPSAIFHASSIELRDDNFELFWTKDKDNPDAILPNNDGTISLYFKAKGKWTIGNGDKIVLKLKGIRANKSSGTRTTRVLLKYENLLHQGTKTFSGIKETHLNLINHRGRKNIPLHAGFVGNNKVLNNGENNNNEKNPLIYRISNTSRNNDVIGAKSQSKIFISFDFGPEAHEWTLTTAEIGSHISIMAYFNHPNISISPLRKVEKDPAISQSTDVIKSQDNVWGFYWPTLHPGQHVDIHITNIKTTHPDGITKMHVHYANIPNYWDGHFNSEIEKSPLITKGQNVGIGIADPTRKLDVVGDVIVRGESIVIPPKNKNKNGLVIYNPSGGTSVLPYTDNMNYLSGNGTILRDKDDNEKFRFDQIKGRVGIGLNNPKCSLHIKDKPTTPNGGAVIIGPTTTSNLRLGYHNNYSWVQSHGSKPLALNSSGNKVGIGMTNPKEALDVNGNIKSKGSIITPKNKTVGLHISNSSYGHAFLPYSDNWNYLAGKGTILRGELGEKFRFDHMTGRMGIGTSNPAINLHIARGGINQPGLRIDGSSGKYWDMKVEANDTGDQDLLFVFTGGELTDNWASIWVEPKGGIRGGSDKKLKKNIASIDGVLEKVLKLKPRAYHWKTETKKTAPKALGFIAQEVEKLFPDLVKEKEGLKTLAYNDFIPLAISAIQEQNKELKACQKELKTQEKLIAKLSKRLDRLEAKK